MAVRIRLTRTGRKNLPSYRIAVFDGRTRRDGPSLEVIGWFNPLSREAGKGFKVQSDRLEDWVNRGAHVTLAVRQLLVRQGVPLPAAVVKAAAKPVRKPRRKAAGKKAARPDASRAARLRKKKAKKASRKALTAKRAAAARAAAAAKAE